MRRNLIAAINVGSHAIQMKIGEVSKLGNFRELEQFRKGAVFGHDTFTKEKVSFQSADKACAILKSFKQTMDAYGIKTSKIMATSAIREASNKDYILDQIKLKTGFEIEVIDNSQEQFLTLKGIKNKLENYDQLIQEGAVVVVIGAGSIQVTTYRHGELKSSQNVKMGALRVKEILGALEDQTLNYYSVLEEYIHVNLEGLDLFEDSNTYEHLIVAGGEIDIINQLIQQETPEETQYMKKKKFKGLLRKLKDQSTEEIKRTYDISSERAAILVPSMLLFQKFIDVTLSKEIIVPNVFLVDGIVQAIYQELYHLKDREVTVKDIITNAVVIAKKYNYNKAHSMKVEENALLLFRRLKEVHGLKEERILLEVACILHDIGKYISLDQHNIHSYELIRSLEIFGMSKIDMEMVANISRYHSMKVPKEKEENFIKLPGEKRIIVAKLIAIIRIADALDRSHKQKIELTSVKLKDKKLIIKGRSKKDTSLEAWNFERKSEFFVEVFGITPVLKITKII